MTVKIISGIDYINISRVAQLEAGDSVSNRCSVHNSEHIPSAASTDCVNDLSNDARDENEWDCTPPNDDIDTDDTFAETSVRAFYPFLKLNFSDTFDL